MNTAFQELNHILIRNINLIQIKSKNHIKEGLNIGTKYIDFINNKMNLSNKFLLQDNEFRTYTNS